ncbi:MAG: FAD-binding protein [Actinomycetota bacterium]|nr:FAD-binding protein [Actinomycetota bacterium]
MSATLHAEAIEQIQQTLRAHARVLPCGGGTKPALSSPPEGTTALHLSEVAGIIDYDPEELTFTACAGTPVRDIVAALAENDQYLPFDPPFVDAGATLGGVVAAGTSGPLRYRNGGVRDFVLGVRFLDGRARLVSGGGRVVKNAAGFDLPKLMVGSAGRLGVILELSMKVFPAPKAWASMSVDLPGLKDALQVIGRLATAPFDLEALDLQPPGRLWLRVAGAAEAMTARLQRLERIIERPGERVPDDEEPILWRDARDFAWAPEESSVVKVALTPKRIPELEAKLAPSGLARRYSSGGNLAWLAWDGKRPVQELDDLLRSLDLAGVVLTGSAVNPMVGAHRGGAFARRVKAALDPDGRFPEV